MSSNNHKKSKSKSKKKKQDKDSKNNNKASQKLERKESKVKGLTGKITENLNDSSYVKADKFKMAMDTIEVRLTSQSFTNINVSLRD